MKIQKAREQEIGWKFIRIDHDKEDFDIFRLINEIFRRIKTEKKSAEKLIKKIQRDY